MDYFALLIWERAAEGGREARYLEALAWCVCVWTEHNKELGSHSCPPNANEQAGGGG